MPYADKQAQREYQLQWVRSNREEWIDSQGRVCASCSSSEGPWEVDHIDPSTKVSHRVWSWSRKRREAELAKCQLLCQECHWKKTGSENSGWNHGQTGYKYGCRCDVCVHVTNEKKRANRARRKAVGLRVS